MNLRATNPDGIPILTLDLENWTPRPRPERKALEGRHVRLEPLSVARHGDDLFAASSVDGADTSFRWLFEYPPVLRADIQPWLEKSEASEDPLFFAVINPKTGKAAGRQALMRIDAAHGVIEIGNIYWGPGIAKTPAATEALYLFAKYAFDDLGYRRFEWKCNNANLPSKEAALRFGFSFEGIFRNHMVAKGKNRDTAWYAMIDSEWPVIKAAFEAWLDPANFDAAGAQKRRLQDIRQALNG
ncbi:MAG: GNAT family protein [Rhizobiaceae bacterium]